LIHETFLVNNFLTDNEQKLKSFEDHTEP